MRAYLPLTQKLYATDPTTGEQQFKGVVEVQADGTVYLRTPKGSLRRVKDPNMAHEFRKLIFGSRTPKL